MHTYTFLTDFRGGTYICQKAADDLRSACVLWMEEIASGGYVPHLDVKAFTKAFHADIDELPPVPLDDLRNVWVFHLVVGKDVVDLHVVQTDVLEVGVEVVRVAV